MKERGDCKVFRGEWSVDTEGWRSVMECLGVVFRVMSETEGREDLPSAILCGQLLQ